MIADWASSRAAAASPPTAVWLLTISLMSSSMDTTWQFRSLIVSSSPAKLCSVGKSLLMYCTTSRGSSLGRTGSLVICTACTAFLEILAHCTSLGGGGFMFLTMGGGVFIFLTATPTDDFFLFLKRIFFHSFASSLRLQWLIALLDFFILASGNPLTSWPLIPTSFLTDFF